MKDVVENDLELRCQLVSQSAAAARAGAGLDTVVEVASRISH